MSVLDVYLNESGLTGPRAAQYAADMLTRDAYRHALGDPSAIGDPSWFAGKSPALYAEWVSTYGAPVLSGHGAVGLDNFGAVDWSASNGAGWLDYHRGLIADASAPAYAGGAIFTSAPAGYVPPAPSSVVPPSTLPPAGIAPVTGPSGSQSPGVIAVDVRTMPAESFPAYVDDTGGIVVGNSAAHPATSGVAAPGWAKLALIAGAAALLFRRR